MLTHKLSLSGFFVSSKFTLALDQCFLRLKGVNEV